MSKFNPEHTQPIIDRTKIDRSRIADFSVRMGALGRATKASKEFNARLLDKTIEDSENIIDGRELFLNPDNGMSGIDKLTNVRILPNSDGPEAS